MRPLNYEVVRKLPPPKEIAAMFPLDQSDEKFVEESTEELKRILRNEDKRLIVIVGPCSAWPDTAVFEYARRLKELEPMVGDALKFVLRAYVQKPRTQIGWEGPLFQPDPFSEPDFEAGKIYCRRMMVELVKMRIPIADEAVDLRNASGFLGPLSWVAIGARSSEDPMHRKFASTLPCPVGMKNPSSGSRKSGVNSVVAAQHTYDDELDGHQIKTAGNPYAHLVLRGGDSGSNYHLPFLMEARELLLSSGVQNPAFIVDASHDNVRVNGDKDFLRQIEVISSVMRDVKKHPELRMVHKGFMIESFLKDGCQKIETLARETVDMDGLSGTDPCLGWEKTMDPILSLAEMQRELMK